MVPLETTRSLAEQLGPKASPEPTGSPQPKTRGIGGTHVGRHTPNANVFKSRSGSMVVQTLGVQDDVCPNRAAPGRNIAQLRPSHGRSCPKRGRARKFGRSRPHFWRIRADMKPIFPVFATMSGNIVQCCPASIKFGPISAWPPLCNFVRHFPEIGQTSPGVGRLPS